ncbi:Ring finger domain family protein [Acanthocheilonema viteae]
MYCPICLEIDDGKFAFAALLCGHVFHRNCISSWLTVGNGTKFCPVCRKYADGYLNLYFFNSPTKIDIHSISKKSIPKKSPPKRNKRKFSNRQQSTHRYQLRSNNHISYKNTPYWLRVRQS